MYPSFVHVVDSRDDSGFTASITAFRRMVYISSLFDQPIDLPRYELEDICPAGWHQSPTALAMATG